ncbi:MAG: helix-turn-helix transcriptional regulator [Oxalobacteraceae bacterium]
MSIDRKFDQWNWMQCADIEVVRARMGPCGLGEHFHDKWSIGLILQGVCRFHSGNRQYEVMAAELFMIPPYEVHKCAAASSDVMYQVMYISDDRLAAIAPHLKQFVAGSSVRLKLLPAFLFRLLQQITGEEKDDAVLNDSFRQLDLFFCNGALSCQPKSRHPLQNILHLGWEQAINLGEAEQTTRYSRWHAVRTFQQHIGLSPRLYLRQLRALKARYMLQQGRPLAEVANALHFADQAHFSRVFKSVFGVPPGKLQRVMLGKSSRKNS